MLKIRLSRIGTNKKPFYRVVVVEERSKRTGAYVELLGTYNPLTEPKEIKLKQDRIDYWTKQGAQPSVGFLRIIGKAPQRLPRKPKKEKHASNTNTQPSPTVQETPTQQPQKTESASTEQTTQQEEPTQTPEEPKTEDKQEQPVQEENKENKVEEEPADKQTKQTQ